MVSSIHGQKSLTLQQNCLYIPYAQHYDLPSVDSVFILLATSLAPTDHSRYHPCMVMTSTSQSIIIGTCDHQWSTAVSLTRVHVLLSSCTHHSWIHHSTVNVWLSFTRIDTALNSFHDISAGLIIHKNMLNLVRGTRPEVFIEHSCPPATYKGVVPSSVVECLRWKTHWSDERRTSLELSKYEGNVIGIGPAIDI